MKKGVKSVLTNNALLAISMTIISMMLLKAFALDRKTLLRALLIITLMNYIILKTTQDIRTPGENFVREAFVNQPDKLKRKFILAQ